VIDLFYVEKIGGGQWFTRPITAKKLRCIPTDASVGGGGTGGVMALVYDGVDETGVLRGRLVAGNSGITSGVDCNVNEVVTFKTGVFVVAYGACIVQMYLMGNPEGPQGP
jgi:hypothetical protein